MKEVGYWSRLYGGRVQHWWNPVSGHAGLLLSACGIPRHERGLKAGPALPCDKCVEMKARHTSMKGVGQ